jgi:hypothetical protein
VRAEGANRNKSFHETFDEVSKLGVSSQQELITLLCDNLTAQA